MRKKMTLLNKCKLLGILAFLITQDNNWLWFASKTEINIIGGHSSKERDLEQPQFRWCKVICSPTKPKPGAQRTTGQELSGGTDLLAADDLPAPPATPSDQTITPHTGVQEPWQKGQLAQAKCHSLSSCGAFCPKLFTLPWSTKGLLKGWD
jgi:hypothetical protein